MKNKKIILSIAIIMIFLLGCISGMFYFTRESMASDPKGEISGGETTASVIWDEHWQAIKASVATENGYVVKDPSDPAVKAQGVESGKISYVSLLTNAGTTVKAPYVLVAPDMVITKWKVHGHIHFR